MATITRANLDAIMRVVWPKPDSEIVLIRAGALRALLYAAQAGLGDDRTPAERASDALAEVERAAHDAEEIAAGGYGNGR